VKSYTVNAAYSLEHLWTRAMAMAAAMATVEAAICRGDGGGDGDGGGGGNGGCTDGSWEPPEEGGNQIREAGAGVALFEMCAENAPGAFPMGQLVNAPTAFARADVTRNAQDTRCERSGHAKLKNVRASTVVIEPNEHEYIGAEAHTNNTGELTAMYHALSNALMRPAGEGREIIWSDSLYTINMTTGRWRPRCPRNREIVASTRGLWRRLQRQRDAEVELRHVRSHTRVPGNELADWLAEIGRTEGGRPVSAVRAGCWLRRWLEAEPNTLGDPAGVG